MRLSTFAVLAGCAVLWSASAQAAIVLVSYKGSASGTDGGGLFGAAGATYTNTSFIARYLFDENADPTSPFGTVLNVDLTIGGGTYVFGLSSVRASDEVTPGYARLTAIQRNAILPGGYQYVALSNTLTSPITPADRTIGYADQGSNHPSVASVWNTLSVVGLDPAHGFYTSSFSFQADAITVNSTPSTPTQCCGVGIDAIPEPSAWATAIVGLALAGAALRRRRFGAYA